MTEAEVVVVSSDEASDRLIVCETFEVLSADELSVEEESSVESRASVEEMASVTLSVVFSIMSYAIESEST